MCVNGNVESVCLYVCKYVFYVCMYACMCVNGNLDLSVRCMYVCMFACMYVNGNVESVGSMYVCMYVCMYACIYIYTVKWDKSVSKPFKTVLRR
jgi:hypothetical protein